MKNLIETLIPLILTNIVKLLNPQQIEKVADQALDWCEKAIKRSDNNYDDALLLPLLAIIREAFGIEDDI